MKVKTEEQTQVKTNKSDIISEKEETAEEFASNYKALYRKEARVAGNQIKMHLRHFKQPRVRKKQILT